MGKSLRATLYIVITMFVRAVYSSAALEFKGTFLFFCNNVSFIEFFRFEHCTYVLYGRPRSRHK